MIVATLIAWRHFGPAAAEFRVLAATFHPEQWIDEARGTLGLTAIATLATAPVCAWLAFAIRQPRRRWAQVTTWVTVVAAVLLLTIALVGGSATVGTTPNDSVMPVDALGYALLPGWYTSVVAVLGVAAIVAAVGAGTALLRSSVLDYYRPASWQQDDRWANFVARQQDR